MSEFGESIIKGLESAINEADKAVHHEISEVRRIRNKLEMGVPEFSKTFGLSQRTVEKWDKKDADLTGAVATLMKVIEKNPDAVINALQE
ncbi:MAG: hypothetical protein COB14_07505 [Alphaproteobacteria bacterium]|nr:MAG: hypothetical protein COB14_07505 [Alphaproteobacteria bacterium]